MNLKIWNWQISSLSLILNPNETKMTQKGTSCSSDCVPVTVTKMHPKVPNTREAVFRATARAVSLVCLLWSTVHVQEDETLTKCWVTQLRYCYLHMVAMEANFGFFNLWGLVTMFWHMKWYSDLNYGLKTAIFFILTFHYTCGCSVLLFPKQQNCKIKESALKHLSDKPNIQVPQQ